jgi:uncharacterized protein (TIGR03000 family)
VFRAAAVALLLAPAVALAQGIVTPYRPPVLPRDSPAAIPPLGFPPGVRPPIFNPIPGGWFVPFWSGWGWNQPPVVVVNPPPAAAPAAPNPNRVNEDLALAAAEVPATLKLDLPAAAEVWLDGAKLDGPASATWAIPSPPLKLGSEFTFKIKARWTADGTAYEVERTSTVRAGGTGKLLVVRGTAVK